MVYIYIYTYTMEYVFKFKYMYIFTRMHGVYTPECMAEEYVPSI